VSHGATGQTKSTSNIDLNPCEEWINEREYVGHAQIPCIEVLERKQAPKFICTTNGSGRG